MVQYRVRSGFRIAAWIPALAFALIGIAFGVIAIKEIDRSPIWSVALVLFSLLVTVLGFLFGKIAWTGRVSAAVEEYGVDDPKDIERMRATARLQGRLEE